MRAQLRDHDVRVSLAGRTDRVDDHVGIERLQSAYADLVNRRAWDELGDLFLPDARIRIDTVSADPVELVGPDGFAAFVAPAVQRFAFFEFVVLNRRIELHDDPSTAAARIFMCEIRRDAETLDWSTAFGVYHDRYRRTGTGWRFAGRDYRSLTRTDGPVFDLVVHDLGGHAS